MNATALRPAAICGWCRNPKQFGFYRGERTARCPCDSDYRTPVEARRDLVLDKYGDDPRAYTPAVLTELAKDGLLDITAAFCPAGRLTMTETLAREASAMSAGTAATTQIGAGLQPAIAVAATSGETPNPNPRATPSPEVGNG